MKKGYCLINSTILPEKLYSKHKILYGDSMQIARMVNKFENMSKEKYVIIFYKMPDKELIKNIVYPFIIYTTKKTPKWLTRYAVTKDNKKYINGIINKIISGDKLNIEEENFILKNIRLLHYILVKNIYKLYETKIPESFNSLEKLAVINNAELYLQLLVTTINTYRPKRTYI